MLVSFSLVILTDLTDYVMTSALLVILFSHCHFKKKTKQANILGASPNTLP